MEYGFGGRETFTRAFKDTYGITPAQYRDKPVGLMNYDKPDLSLNYRMVDEGVPLIGEGLVLEYIYPAVGYSVSLITRCAGWVFDLFHRVEPCEEDSRFVSWQLPAREYVICSFEADNPKQLMASMGKMMKFTRSWLKSMG